MGVWFMASVAYPHRDSLDGETPAELVFSLFDHAAQAACFLDLFNVMLLIGELGNRQYPEAKVARPFLQALPSVRPLIGGIILAPCGSGKDGFPNATVHCMGTQLEQHNCVPRELVDNRLEHLLRQRLKCGSGDSDRSRSAAAVVCRRASSHEAYCGRHSCGTRQCG
ncbi:hypothetical protein XANCAGTX0491_001591 [Xanthoria calcicola]